jgi:hypothetical protein
MVTLDNLSRKRNTASLYSRFCPPRPFRLGKHHNALAIQMICVGAPVAVRIITEFCPFPQDIELIDDHTLQANFLDSDKSR